MFVHVFEFEGPGRCGADAICFCCPAMSCSVAK